uniref:Uncharacterized protein n=1 Tax=Cacopsylla melanoneura TaxID=428564 RepID=A0A8D9AYX5_9HEMI
MLAEDHSDFIWRVRPLMEALPLMIYHSHQAEATAQHDQRKPEFKRKPSNQARTCNEPIVLKKSTSKTSCDSTRSKILQLGTVERLSYSRVFATFLKVASLLKCHYSHLTSCHRLVLGQGQDILGQPALIRNFGPPQ